MRGEGLSGGGALAQCGGEGGGVAEAQVDSLAGQRVHAVGRVAHQDGAGAAVSTRVAQAQGKAGNL